MAEDVPAGGWTEMIDAIVAGRFSDPATGRPVDLPFRRIEIAPSLDGAEADLVAPLGLGERLALVADDTTYDALGSRVQRSLARCAQIDLVILNHPHADLATAGDLAARTSPATGLIAIGSGTV